MRPGMFFSCITSLEEKLTSLWYMTFNRNIAIATLLWIFIAATPTVVASLVTMSAESSRSDGGWEATFYYVHPLCSNFQQQDGECGKEFTEKHQPSFHEVNTALRHYREMADGMLRKLSIEHEVASRTEALLFPHHKRICEEDESTATQPSSFLSCRIQDKIAKVGSLLEQNSFVLEQLLKPFPLTIGFSGDGINQTTSPVFSSHFTFPPSNNDDSGQQPSQSGLPIQPLARYIPPYKPSKSNVNEVDGEEEPYDTAAHIITHLARDWTADGASIRKDTHDWIVEQLVIHHNKQQHTSLPSDSPCSQQSPLSPVLVPGAGMARLAFDIAFASNNNDETNAKCYTFAVEAIDNSIVMATAAHHLLQYLSNHDKKGDSVEIYPIASDPFVNEVDTERRWISAVFPEDNVSDQFDFLHKQQSFHQPSLSYVIGDFVSTYASVPKHGMYGSIATCFFIDTATNIYEYILTIRNLLRIGGMWINLGPVQWHQNAQLQPSANELKGLIQLAGFQVIHWEISDQLLAYRHPDDIRVGTRAEAYRPLKFVVALQPDGNAQPASSVDNDLISSLNKSRLVTGRKPMVNNDDVDDEQMIESFDVLDD